MQIVPGDTTVVVYSKPSGVWSWWYVLVGGPTAVLGMMTGVKRTLGPSAGAIALGSASDARMREIS
jgi:hypothetical protein